MSSNVTLRALGLNYSPNLLGLPEGSLVTANNVIIRRDDVIESRRGMREYSEGIGTSTDHSKQLIEYKDRLLVHYANKLAYDTTTLNTSDKSIFNDFDGIYEETQAGLRIKSIESNKNLYFTSSDGIKKISAKTAADFTTASGFIVDAGAIKAVDLSATLSITQGQIDGFLPNDSAVAYRYLFGYKDNNNNLILGSASDRIVVYNYLSDVLSMDTNTLTVALDDINQTSCLINDGDYASSFYTPAGTSEETLKNNVINLAKKLDDDIVLASGTGPLTTGTGCTINVTDNVCTITFASGDPTQYISVGDIISLNMTVNSSGVNDAPRTISAVTSTTISFPLTTANANHTNQTGTINSYNYRNITETGDDVYAQPLDTLVISTPATSEELRIIHHNLFRIVERLKSELSGVIPSTLQSTYITPFILTESANVNLNITLPTNLPDYYFVQVYRTRIFTADSIQTLGGSGGIPVVPDDEMRLAFEQFPTAGEISAGELDFLDNYPEELVQNNTNLYTNPVTGEGILQSNDLPPFAKDINRFKNVTFYANTRTRHRLNPFQLLGVTGITGGDKLTLANVTSSDTYTFVDGTQEVTDITTTTVVVGDAGKYFILYTPNGDKNVFWLYIDNTGSEPVVSGTTKYIRVSLLSTNTANQNAEQLRDTINTLVYDYAATSNTNITTVTNIEFGKVTDGSAGNSPFSLSVTTQGDGEDAALKQVLKSNALSAAQAIDETARSLVRVINKQPTDIASAYYVSSDTTPPGQINLEAKNIDDTPFYVLGSNEDVGISFNPDISPINTNVTSISAANPSVVTTSAPHGLQNLAQIMISGSDSTPSIDGIHSVTVINSISFSVPVNVTIAGTTAAWSKLEDINKSDNEVKPNRIYYSKLNQPEAVPILNFFDVGPEDKEILRIYPLRDSLFVFKQDGLYRVSGETSPFVQGLFDSSCILVAPDSVAVSNNEIYCWTSKGISKVTETGVSEISRPIDTEILKISSAGYSNFSKLTWGVGYDSDNSYTVYTNSAIDDDVATIAFRYSNLTNTWTNIVRTQTCGIVFDVDDKLYMGAGESNLIEQERKTFTRKDYADKDFAVQLGTSALSQDGKTIRFTDVSDIKVGDVVTQEQSVSIYDFNKLLTQLDNDFTVGLNTISSSSGAGTTITITTSTAHGLSNGDIVVISNSNSDPIIDGTYTVSNVAANTFDITVSSALTTQATAGSSKRSYTDMFEISNGQSLRSKLVQLAQKLDTDPGATYTDYLDRIDTKSGSISSNSVAASTVLTTASPHELINGRIITISGTQSPLSIPTLNGTYAVSNTGTFPSSTQFTIPVTATTGGGSGLTFATAQNELNFDDIQVCFNEIVNRLNADPGVTFSNYKLATTSTLIEAVVTAVNTTTKRVTLNLALPWIVGEMTVYKAIPCEFVYSPLSFGDPLMFKQIYEATVMFNSKAFTKVVASFSSDLKPAFTDIELYGQGNGIFGHYSDPGFGYGFFGGGSNAAPSRTYVPRDSQRCRFLNVKISHATAREIFSIFGMSLTGNVGISTRAYK